MTAWHEGPIAGFDLETTGPDPETARIVTAAIIRRGDANGITRTWLVDPGIDIPAEATAIHGITTEAARADGIEAAAAIRDIAGNLAAIMAEEVPVVIFNAPYDLTVLDRETRRHGIPGFADAVTFGPVIDPFVLDKHLDRYRRGSRKLTAVCEHYNVTLDDAHDSTADALAAMRVAWRIAQVFPAIGQLDLWDLHSLQVDARAGQAASFADYLRKTGKPEDIDGSWPLRKLAPAVTT